MAVVGSVNSYREPERCFREFRPWASPEWQFSWILYRRARCSGEGGPLWWLPVALNQVEDWSEFWDWTSTWASAEPSRVDCALKRRFCEFSEAPGWPIG